MLQAFQDFAVGRSQAWLDMVMQPHNIAAICFLVFLLAVALGRRGWRKTMTRRAIVSSTASLAIFHYNFFLSAIAVLGATAFGSLYQRLGIPIVPTEFWSQVPVWLLIPLGVLLVDFADYWAHRALHTTWLWPIHAVHHSDPEVNGLTTFRVHMFEGLVMLMTYTVVLSWLGLPAEIIAASATIRLLHNIYVHIDVDWGHGPLRRVIASPRFHRWHHADEPAVYGKNLANIFPFYDVWFGTYYNATQACDRRLGAPGVPENNVARLLLWPLLEWPRMLAERFRSMSAASGVNVTKHKASS